MSTFLKKEKIFGGDKGFFWNASENFWDNTNRAEDKRNPSMTVAKV